MTFAGFSRPWDKDRIMYTDIDAATNLLIDEHVWNTVKPYIDKYFAEYRPETRPPSPTTSVRRKRSRNDTDFEFDKLEIITQ